jgi:hypothetical protein
MQEKEIIKLNDKHQENDEFMKLKSLLEAP